MKKNKKIIANTTKPIIFNTTSPCIFTVHGMANLTSNSKNRTFGWYPKFLDAEKAVRKNCCNIYEFQYDYMVIEEIPEGVFGLRKQEWWYKWNGKEFIKINKPQEIFNVVNFGIG